MARPRKEANHLSAAVTVHMTPELRARLAAAAEEERRKLGDYARLLIEDAMNDRDRRRKERASE